MAGLVAVIKLSIQKTTVMVNSESQDCGLQENNLWLIPRIAWQNPLGGFDEVEKSLCFYTEEMA